MGHFVDSFVHKPGIYRDIMDGKVYQEHSTIIKVGGYFPITLYWHLDGAPALKSKNMSLWPIQSFVAETASLIAVFLQEHSAVWLMVW